MLGRLWRMSEAGTHPTRRSRVTAFAHFLGGLDRSCLTLRSQARFAAFAVAPRLAPATVRLTLSDGTPMTVRWRTSDPKVVFSNLMARCHELPAGWTPPDLVIDAGANIGASALFYTREFASARVVAVEPDRESYELLESATHRSPRITCLRAAVWPRHEPLELHDRGIGPWGFQAIPAPGAESPLPTVTIPELLAEHAHPGERILLKLDVEGAEHDLLLAPDDWIERIAILAVELHHDLHPDVAAVAGRATAGFFRCAKRFDMALISRD